MVLQPGVLEVAFGHPIAQLAGCAYELLAAMAVAQDLLERRAGFCISHQRSKSDQLIYSKQR